MSEKNKSQFSEAVMKATGEIEFKLTNDAMFKLVLQDNEKVLKGLISSMLHIPENDINQLKVENPIIPGEGINDKTFVLDIKISLNNKMIINLEMQLLDYHNWQNRSLCYLCRNFVNLQRGEDYNSIKPIIHIGFLDFDLFEDDDEFYSRFRILNTKNHREYNSNFRLNVLYLNRIENATKEDRNWKIDEWAKLFKANNWEDLRMIAQHDETMISAVETMYEKHMDEMALEIMIRKQDEIIHQRCLKREKEKMLKENADLKNENANLKNQNTDLKNQNTDLENKNTDLENKYALSEKEIARLMIENESLKRQLADTNV